MDNATFSSPDLDAFCMLDRLGLTAPGQRLEQDQAVLQCRSREPDPWCRACGTKGVAVGMVPRPLAHGPLGWRPTLLQVRVRRYRCEHCQLVWREDLDQAAAPRSKLTRHAVLWALKALVMDRMSISRIATALGVAWHTVNTAVLDLGHQLLIDDPSRFDGVRVIGVDEHVWRHAPGRDRFVTVIIDLTPIREATGPSRLLDMVPGRSKKVLATWLNEQPPGFRDGVEVVAMDGFTGFKTAAAEQLPAAVAVMDPFHVVALAGDALDRCRQRIQQQTRGHRGRSGDPLYGIRRTLRTGVDLLTGRHCDRLTSVFATDQHAAVEATWGIYQRIVQANRRDNRATGKQELSSVISALAKDVPAALSEVTTLGRTLKRRAEDVLAYFDRPGTSNGPTEAINGRLEHLRGTALGFRNLAHYITRALLDTGGFRPAQHPQLR
ncbi:ISL3 family transposase [Brachybacterium squillarum]|uniref:ISL3 family transposase n=1 Tax=Brachybacterium squillarum TaxID=661979 RepID=UPI0002629FD7|nr:ISL3 family transposase [Brachybacterium squillarum]